MSVQKYVIGSKKGGYTAVPNHVIKGLKDYALIGLYLYLIHLPEGWEFHKNHLQKQGNIGRDKLDKLLSMLEAHGLIKMAQKRDSNGRFSHFIMDVLDGSDFKIREIESCPQKAETPFTEKPLTENRLLVNRTYKRNTYKTNKDIKEIKSSYAARPKNKQQKQKQETVVPIDHFLSGFGTSAERKKANEQKHGFADTMNRQSQVRCTIPEYGPGHPTWEAQQEWKRNKVN